MWETVQKWLEPSSLCSAHFVDADQHQFRSWKLLGRQNYIAWEYVSPLTEIQKGLMNWIHALG